MKLKTPVLALIGLLAAAPAVAAEKSITFSVPGMTCASCPFIVEAAMSGVEGVVTVTADSDSLTAQVVYDDAVTTIDDIALASGSAGYEAKLLDADS